MKQSLFWITRRGIRLPIATCAYIAEFVVQLEERTGHAPSVVKYAPLKTKRAAIRADPELRRRIDLSRNEMKIAMTQISKEEAMSIESRFKVGLMQAEV